jgi:excisionase family DNA binding protein
MLENLILSLINQAVEEKLASLEKKLLNQIGVNQDPFLTRQEAAGYLGCCLASLDNYVRDGRLEKYKVGRKTLFKRTDLQRLPI